MKHENKTRMPHCTGQRRERRRDTFESGLQNAESDTSVLMACIRRLLEPLSGFREVLLDAQQTVAVDHAKIRLRDWITKLSRAESPVHRQRRIAITNTDAVLEADAEVVHGISFSLLGSSAVQLHRALLVFVRAAVSVLVEEAEHVLRGRVALRSRHLRVFEALRKVLSHAFAVLERKRRQIGRFKVAGARQLLEPRNDFVAATARVVASGIAQRERAERIISSIRRPQTPRLRLITPRAEAIAEENTEPVGGAAHAELMSSLEQLQCACVINCDGVEAIAKEDTRLKQRLRVSEMQSTLVVMERLRQAASDASARRKLSAQLQLVLSETAQHIRRVATGRATAAGLLAHRHGKVQRVLFVARFSALLHGAPAVRQTRE